VTIRDKVLGVAVTQLQGFDTCRNPAGVIGKAITEAIMTYNGALYGEEERLDLDAGERKELEELRVFKTRVAGVVTWLREEEAEAASSAQTPGPQPKGSAWYWGRSAGLDDAKYALLEILYDAG
jgi:hypothetical protein